MRIKCCGNCRYRKMPINRRPCYTCYTLDCPVRWAHENLWHKVAHWLDDRKYRRYKA